MSVKPIIPSIESNNKGQKIKVTKMQPAPVNHYSPVKKANVSFTGSAPLIVTMMDAIAAGGFAASFIIQDGIGFILPRVGKGILRGGKEKRDENGNIIYGKDGKPKRELNWEYARKEALREIITGPSAFLIPWLALKGIKKYAGSANNVKMDYIDGFRKPFTEFVNADINSFKSGNLDRANFYEKVYANIIEKTINSKLPAEEAMSTSEIKNIAKELTQTQIQIEDIKANKSLSKRERKKQIKEIKSIEDRFMELKKSKIGGITNEMVADFSAFDGKIKSGPISKISDALTDYYKDATQTVKKALKDNLTSENLENVMKSFTNKKLGTRFITNMGLFGAVAAFYTQIPKLYNMGLSKNPALADSEISTKPEQTDNKAQTNKKDVQFTGLGRVVESAGEKVFNGKHAKKISDIFELNGPIITGTAMTALLYGFCIPPRLSHAQDKYDYGEIIVRDLTSFTALLFGAKALERLFSDFMSKHTGLALNSRNLAGRNAFQKVFDYLSPNDDRHSVLSSKQLDSKYTNIHEYKNGVNGFVEFIEKSGGDVKKAFTHDKDIMKSVENIIQDFNGKTFKEATTAEIKEALKTAHSKGGKLIEDFYNSFKDGNGLLNKAKKCNSSFGFLSTIAFVPGFIMWLTNFCEKMTERRAQKDRENNTNTSTTNNLNTNYQFVKMVSQAPSMAGFLSK